MDITAEITETDNLEEVQEQEPETQSDNSEIEQSEKPESEEKAEDTSNYILGKFKSQDDLIKAYTSLEQNQGKKAQELAELKQKAELVDSLQKQQQEIAELYGFKNVEELNNFQNQKKVDKDLANFVADEYAKHLGQCEYPDEMRSFLLQYKQDPNSELLTTIKNEFPLDVIEQVAVNIHGYKGQLEQIKHQALEQQEIERAGNYLKETIAKYDDDRYFKNNEFKAIYTELFKAFGTDLNTDYTVDMIEKYVQSRIAQHEKTKSMRSENDKLTDSFGGLSTESTTGSKSVLDMTEEELSKALRTTYKHL